MKTIAQVMDLYAELDQQVVQFQLESGLRCLPGCGKCCPVSKIHTTVLEMLPLAGEILRQGASEMWLERIARTDPARGCVLYQTELPAGSPGHCSHYAWRPSVCRLFGFASVRMRNNRLELAACKQLKATSAEQVALAAKQSAKAPCVSDMGALLYAIDPATGCQLMPINEALQRAIQRLGLRMQMYYGEAMGSVSAA